MSDTQPAAFLALFAKYGARMTLEDIGAVLRINKNDAAHLVAKRLLIPLGNPKRNSVKWFCTYTIAELIQQEDWLGKVVRACQANHA